MSTVLRREPPFKTLLGHGLVFGEDGRQMSKSWGNSIEFNEGAERMGVDVIRWLFAKTRPEDNILFGYHMADDARRELLVLWNVFAFFAKYASLADWAPSGVRTPKKTDVLDRWILSRTAGLAADVGRELADYDARAAALRLGEHIDDLSTWYLRRSRRRLSRRNDISDGDQAFAVLHTALVSLSRVMAPILPFLAEGMYQRLAVTADDQLPDSVHLTSWPDSELAPLHDGQMEKAMSTLRRAVELMRTLRGQAGIRLRQPLARMWLALPGGSLGAGDPDVEQALLELLREEVNVKQLELIGDDSALVERRVKPLLPRIGPRLGAAIPSVMAAARANEVEYLPGGGVRLAGVELAPDEVEILATPRPGTAVAHDEGLVVIAETEIDDALRAEGDARELTRAVQDLRKQAGLELDEEIQLWLVATAEQMTALEPHLGTLADDTIASSVLRETPPADVVSARQTISSGEVVLALRGLGASAR
jgi:isoleucyl-tRNA synthetase